MATWNIHGSADPCGQSLRHLNLDLNNEPPPFTNNEAEGVPILSSSMVDDQQNIWVWVPAFSNYYRARVISISDLNLQLQGCPRERWPMNLPYYDPNYYYFYYYDLNGYAVNNHELQRRQTNSMAQVGQPNVLVAPFEQPHGPNEVVGLNTYDERADNGHWNRDNDNALARFIASIEQAGSSRATQGIDSESLRIADNHQRNVRRRVESQPQVNNRDFSVHLGGAESSMVIPQLPGPKPVAPQPPTFECPVCMKPLAEPMATGCGHMFCEGCIKTAIGVQPKCPICRRKIVRKELRKIYFT